MKRIFLRVVLLLTVVLMLSGLAFAESGAGSEPYFIDSNVFYVPVGYYTSRGDYVEPGYYLMDGTYYPLGEYPGLSEDENPGDSEDSVVPGDPVEPEDPTGTEDSVEPDDPTISDDPVDSDTPELNPELSRQIIRIGLRYGSNAMDGANLGNSVGSGFRFGYYDSNNQFVSVGYTSHTTISVVKTENVYYGTYNNYSTYYDHLTNSSVGVGCYHLQYGGAYSSFEEAYAVAGQFNGGFVAYINGAYYARIGNYLNRDAAVAAQSNYAANGYSTELKGTSAYGINVVITGTNTVIFQYDDNGTGTGLGVEPIPGADGQKCISLFASVRYYGGFRYERIDGGDLTIVNMIAVDDYLKGVICEEMSSSWPIEALKAQAVAARSYVLHNLGSHSRYHFDACTINHCQVYGGLTRAAESTDAAVDATMGVVARYDGKIIDAVFYSSNGGASESSSLVWGSAQSRYPYLVGVEDPYEATINITGYEWTRTYTGNELAEILKSVGYNNCTTIVSVKITEYSDSGNPAQVTFTDSQGRSYPLTAYAMNKHFPLRSWRYEFANAAENELTINGETPVDSVSGLYALDGNGNLVIVQDNAYIITDDGTVSAAGGGLVTGDVFTIVGRGWGHNVGMSQYGANAMARLGFTYDQILMFYYTGITVG